MRLRRIRSDEGDDVSSDALTSSNVDTTLLNDLASVEIDENGEGLSERKRREKVRILTQYGMSDISHMKGSHFVLA